MGEDRSAAKAEVDAVRLALDLGMTVIDTAEMYGDGGAERIVGEALKDRREDAFLVSKVLPWNASYDGHDQAWHASLNRLGTDHLDLYLLHARRTSARRHGRCDGRAEDAGRIRAWGVSNFDVDDMEELFSVADGENCAVNQVLYNLSRRGIEFDLLPWCQEHKIPVMAYSPIEQGRILQHPELIHVAKAYQATPAQVALAFLLERESVIPIPKTSNLRRCRKIARPSISTISDEDWARLDAAFRHRPRKVPRRCFRRKGSKRSRSSPCIGKSRSIHRPCISGTLRQPLRKLRNCLFENCEKKSRTTEGQHGKARKNRSTSGNGQDLVSRLPRARLRSAPQ